MNPRACVRLAAIASLALALTACGGSSLDSGEDAGGSDSVKVGLVVPLSGVYAGLGADMRQAFQLYLDEHGGKLGGRDIELVAVDEGDGPQTGVPVATKLVQQDKVDVVVGVVNSAVALGVRNLFTESKVPLIISNAGANDITGSQGSPYLWRTSFANGEVAAALGGYVADQVKGGSVYLLAPDYAAGKESVAGFRQAFEAAGGKVADEKLTPFGTTKDFQPYLSAVQRSGAKAVYCFYSGAEAVSFVKQYKQFGLAGKIPLYAVGFLTEGDVLPAQGDAAIGIQTSLHYAAALDNPANAKFVASYQGKYNEPPTTFAAQTYDAAAVLDKALAAVKGAVSGEAIAGALPNVGQIDSPRGPWSFGPNRNPQQKYYLREVREDGGALTNAVIRELSPS